MKHIIAASLLLLLSAQVYSQDREVRNVTGFSKLSFGVPGKLYLKQGAEEKVELAGDPDILKRVETEVSGGRLSIRSAERQFNWNWGKEKITVYVTMKNIEGVQVGGSGDLLGEGRIKAQNLDLKVSGSGSLTLEAAVSGPLEADVSGSGNIKMKGTAASLKSDVSGSGNVTLDVDVDAAASFSISGSGKVGIQGGADNTRISISGSGSVHGADFVVNTCDVRIAGSGDVEIHVKKELEADISGSGTVTYRGDPAKIDSHSAGSGKVRKM